MIFVIGLNKKFTLSFFEKRELVGKYEFDSLAEARKAKKAWSSALNGFEVYEKEISNYDFFTDLFYRDCYADSNNDGRLHTRGNLVSSLVYSALLSVPLRKSAGKKIKSKSNRGG